MIYKGSCHCGKIALEVEGELTAAMSCNCSICSRKGLALVVRASRQAALTHLGAGCWYVHVQQACHPAPFLRDMRHSSVCRGRRRASPWQQSIFAASKALTLHPFR